MQRILPYSRFFFFFFTRFNPFLAACLLYDEIKGEIKYKLNTTDFHRPPRLKQSDFAATSAFAYMPSNYVLLQMLFTKLNQFSHNQTLLDVGSGKGRVLSVAAHFGFKEITGVEVVPEYCEDALQKINNVSKKFPDTTFKIICTDAAQFSIPLHIQNIFLYNPFKEVMIEVLISNILSSFKKNPRHIYVIYLNPLFIQNFIAVGFKPDYSATRFYYIKATLLSLSPA